MEIGLHVDDHAVEPTVVDDFRDPTVHGGGLLGPDRITGHGVDLEPFIVRIEQKRRMGSIRGKPGRGMEVDGVHPFCYGEVHHRCFRGAPHPHGPITLGDGAGYRPQRPQHERDDHDCDRSTSNTDHDCLPRGDSTREQDSIQGGCDTTQRD